MRTPLQRISPQPLTGMVALVLGAIALAAGWSGAWVRAAFEPRALLLALFLLGAFLVATRFPIHVRHNVKLMILTLQLFLMAALLPPPLAATTAGIGWLLFGLDARKRMKLFGSDIATWVGRWTFTVYVTSLIAHVDAQTDELGALVLLGAAVFMFCADMVGAAFEISAMTGETPWDLVRTLVREMSAPEAVQYMLGILGTLVARQHAWALALLVVPLVLVYVAFKHLKELQENTRRMLEEMADAIDQRDPYTGGHSRRVTQLCQAILEQLPLSGPEADLIMAAARVHDIGKFGIPEGILKKPSTLTPDERRLIETHVELGVKLLRGHTDFERGREIVLHHHERWDGTGYPSGLREQEIPLGARVIAVADSFDAMISDRPYRRAFGVEQALRTLQEGRGTQWDPRIVDALIAARAAAAAQSLPKPEPNVSQMQTV